MKKYTANYVNTTKNFVIQNLDCSRKESDYLSVFLILKNILQRGAPTRYSKYLECKLGEIHNEKLDIFAFISNEPSYWHSTIKGDDANNNFPAKDFLEKIVPAHFGEYQFVQMLMLPEVLISDIVDSDNNDFIHQQVDFFIPQVNLAIEIDGSQHKEPAQIQKDKARDTFLANNGVKTVRISTQALKDGSFITKIEDIIKYLENYKIRLSFFQATFENIQNKDMTKEVYKTKILPTAVIRYQILILELLISGKLNLLDAEWNFTVLDKDAKIYASHSNKYDAALKLALEDIFIWIENLCALQNRVFNKPQYTILPANLENELARAEKGIRINFSLLKRYTDENTKVENVIFVRTDYFAKNYFEVETSKPIIYKLKSTHINPGNEPTNQYLEFFLKNIFGKDKLRPGQYDIIKNILERKPTLGLLPTGGGKSICYQLPCLLQPCISFVVCPIKSLMSDQKQNLDKIFITHAQDISSDSSLEDKKKAEINFQNKKYFFVLISPERFQIETFRQYISKLNSQIAYAIIDEVHCLSEWGHDFRTSYLNLAKTIRTKCPQAVFLGLTATASENVKKDVCFEFKIEDTNIFTPKDYSRPELNFTVVDAKDNKYNILYQQMQKLAFTVENKNLEYDKGCVVFTQNVNGAAGCYQAANNINAKFGKDLAKYYAGSIPNLAPFKNDKEFAEYKKLAQNEFTNNKFPIMVATKAFGMGIDKPNIHYTFHFGLPGSLESLYQEAGRAGRWDKTKDEHKDKRAECFILHSRETVKQDVLDTLFNKDTNFSTIEDIVKSVGFNGKDIFSTFFLFLQGQKNLEENFAIIMSLYNNYCKASIGMKILNWYDASKYFYEEGYYKEIYIKEDKNYEKKIFEKEEKIFEKSIYRLSLLGIVEDWTSDFAQSYTITVSPHSEEDVMNNLVNYIQGSQDKSISKLEIEKKIRNIQKPTLIEKCVFFLLQWIWDNIVYTRRQGIKNLTDKCLNFKNSTEFRESIENFFKITLDTQDLQKIAADSLANLDWFHLFYAKEITGDRFKKNDLIFSKQLIENEKLKTLRDQVSRLLESYRDSIGLNAISGFVYLFLNAYENTDGRIRLESSLKELKNRFSKENESNILEKMIELGTYLDEPNKYLFAKSMLRFYPDLFTVLVEKLNLITLLVEKVLEKKNQIQALNQKIYGLFE